jgi:hypothetical protein
MNCRIGKLLLAGAISTAALAPSGRLAAQGDSEPCCNIAKIDAAAGVITVKDKSSRFTFLLTLANQKAAADLRVGGAVAFSNRTKTITVFGAGRPQELQLSQVQFTGFNQGNQVGAVGSSASSSGGFQNPTGGKCGKVGQIIETATQQCVVTTSSGPGCWYCVSIKK